MGDKQKKEIFLYMFIVYGVTYGAFICSKVSSLNYRNIAAASMLLPTLGAVISTVVFKDDFDYIKENLKINKWIFIGIFFMLIIYVISSLFQVIVYKCVLDKSAFIRFPNVSDFLKNLVIGGILGGITALFEEIGWRGFLQSRLSAKSTVKSYFIIGVLWVVFHLPQIFNGVIYKGDLIEGIIVHTCMLICFGILLCYVLEKSSSLICTSLMHGLFNALIYTEAASVILNGSQIIEGFVWAALFFTTLIVLLYRKFRVS